MEEEERPAGDAASSSASGPCDGNVMATSKNEYAGKERAGAP